MSTTKKTKDYKRKKKHFSEQMITINNPGECFVTKLELCKDCRACESGKKRNLEVKKTIQNAIVRFLR